MKRKIFFLFVLLVIGILIIFVVRFLSSRSPKEGKLKVTSTPVSSVFIDNKHVGRTPYEDKVAAGEVTVKIVPESTLTSVSSWQGKVTISPNTLTFINRDLTESELTSSGEILWLERITSKASEVDVVTTPDGASILLDDALKGISPLSISDVSPTDHTLTVTSPGFLTKTLKIKTTAGYKVKVAMQLALNSNAPTPSPTPEAAVTASPATTPSVTPNTSPTRTPTPASTPSVTPRATPSPSPRATPTNPPAPYIIIKDTPTGYLRVRAEASTTSAEVGRVNPGDKFHIEDTKEVSGVTWYQIKYDGTNLGWVSGTYVDKVE